MTYLVMYNYTDRASTSIHLIRGPQLSFGGWKRRFGKKFDANWSGHYISKSTYQELLLLKKTLGTIPYEKAHNAKYYTHQ